MSCYAASFRWLWTIELTQVLICVYGMVVMIYANHIPNADEPNLQKKINFGNLSILIYFVLVFYNTTVNRWVIAFRMFSVVATTVIIFGFTLTQFLFGIFLIVICEIPTWL